MSWNNQDNVEKDGRQNTKCSLRNQFYHQTLPFHRHCHQNPMPSSSTKTYILKKPNDNKLKERKEQKTNLRLTAQSTNLKRLNLISFKSCLNWNYPYEINWTYSNNTMGLQHRFYTIYLDQNNWNIEGVHRFFL